MTPTPTPFAYVALLGWPFVALLLFWRLRPATAAAWTIFGGELLLPELVKFDFRGLPPLDRTSITCLAALVACVALQPGSLRGRLPGGGVELLLVILVAGAFLTTLGNGDAVVVGGVVCPA